MCNDIKTWFIFKNIVTFFHFNGIITGQVNYHFPFLIASFTVKLSNLSFNEDGP